MARSTTFPITFKPAVVCSLLNRLRQPFHQHDPHSAGGAFITVSTIAILLTLPVSDAWGLAKTRGTPIGGMGTGYVVFNAVTGDFATSQKIPPPASFGKSEFTNFTSNSAGFHFVAGDSSVYKAKTDTEDAKCPLYTADFGSINRVTFSLNAFGPFVTGDTPLNYQLATSPLAFFEITATNRGTTAIEVAAAMEFTNRSASRNLLGGADNAVVDPESGNRAILFSGSRDTGNAYLAVDCDGAQPSFSAGALGTFLKSGSLTDSAGNLVAAKCTLPAGGSIRFKFVLSWWRTFVSTVDRYGSGTPDEENYYYHNFYADAKSAGEVGMSHFDLVRDGVVTMVERVMGSNFPFWYKERLLNNTYPLIHNAQCAKDGRVAFWEGRYPIIGTIDQSEHASVFYLNNWPKIQWQELQYWLRTAHTGVDEDVALKGQIHHDFNSGPEKWTTDAHFMCPWDNVRRDDYWYHPNTTDWSDLNTMAIFKTYELMLATGSIDSMKIYFPLILRTAERLLVQCTEAGKHLPLTSRSTYDSELGETPQYASGIALAAFLAVANMADFVGDSATAIKFRDWYTIARQEFRALIYNSNFCTGRNFAEGDIAGCTWANYLCLNPVMDDDIVDEGCRRLWDFYTTSAVTTAEQLGRWHFYTCDHWGGAEIARGKPDTAMMLFKWDYDYFHAARPETVFWQDLWGNNNVNASYITAPGVWRSYFQMTGYLLDNANKRLWLRPRIPGEMGNRLSNAPLPNPYGWGNLNFDGTIVDIPGQSPKRTQQLLVTFDSLVTVKELILSNNTGVESPFVLITTGNGKVSAFTCITEGTGFGKNISITFENPIQIGPSGLFVEVYTGEVGVSRLSRPKSPFSLSINTAVISSQKPIQYSVNVAGPVTIDLLTLNGAKIGTVLQRNIEKPGIYHFTWRNRAGETGAPAPKIMVMRLSTRSATICRLVSVELK